MFEVMKNGILCDGWGEKTIYWLIQGSNLCAVLKLINLSSANFIISSFMEIVPRHIAISKIETINVKLILIMINFIVTGILCFCREFLPSHSFLTNYLFFFNKLFCVIVVQLLMFIFFFLLCYRRICRSIQKHNYVAPEWYSFSHWYPIGPEPL